MPTADAVSDADRQLITYLKAGGLYDHLAAAAGVAKSTPIEVGADIMRRANAVQKDATVADVHVASDIDISTIKTDEPEDDVLKALTISGHKMREMFQRTDDAIEDSVQKLLAQQTILKRIDDVDVVFSKGDANLFVSRPLTAGSAQRLHEWALAQGIKNVVPPELMHVTQVHSKAPVDTTKFTPQQTLVEVPTDMRWLSQLGKDNALVLFFSSAELQQRFKEAEAAGATWDFKSFMPHITLSYDTDAVDAHLYGMDPPPDFPLQLGPEEFKASNDNWVQENKLAKVDDGGFEFVIDIKKAAPDQQMIFGWASVSSINGQDIIDKQGDIVPVEELEKAAYDFTLYSRTHGEMHENIGTGRMIESMVFTPEKAALGVVAKNEKGEPMMGWWVGFKVENPQTWADARSGRLPEFSIGGRATPHSV